VAGIAFGPMVRRYGRRGEVLLIWLLLGHVAYMTILYLTNDRYLPAARATRDRLVVEWGGWFDPSLPSGCSWFSRPIASLAIHDHLRSSDPKILRCRLRLRGEQRGEEGSGGTAKNATNQLGRRETSAGLWAARPLTSAHITSTG
jgi:hypothetical protein